MLSCLKRTAKYIGAVILYYAGLIAIITFFKRLFLGRKSPLILMYHRVLDENDEKSAVQAGLYVTKDIFEKQMLFLSRNYDIITQSNYLNCLLENRTYPQATALITFDDGWRDNYTQAFPILMKHKINATIFLAVDFIESDNIFWFYEISMVLAKSALPKYKIAEMLRNLLKSHSKSESAKKLLGEPIESYFADNNKLIEKLKFLEPEIIVSFISCIKRESDYISENDRRLLIWQEVREMAQGGIEFGSHGLSHRILTALEADEINKELVQSKRIIEEKLGACISVFSYPNGNCNAQIRGMVADAGYNCAFLAGKSDTRALDRYAIGRVSVHNDVSVGLTGKFSKAMFALHLQRSS